MKDFNKKTSIFMGGNDNYDKNYNRIFHKSFKEKIKTITDNILIYFFLRK